MRRVAEPYCSDARGRGRVHNGHRRRPPNRVTKRHALEALLTFFILRSTAERVRVTTSSLTIKCVLKAEMVPCLWPNIRLCTVTLSVWRFGCGWATDLFPGHHDWSAVGMGTQHVSLIGRFLQCSMFPQQHHLIPSGTHVRLRIWLAKRMFNTTTPTRHDRNHHTSQ